MKELEIKSEVTGTVWSIPAEVGEQLDEDDPIIMVESMKMEIPVCAPAQGTLTEIKVTKGDTVTTGQVVATFTS